MSDSFPRGEFPPERSREVKLDDQVAAAHVEALLDDIRGHNGVGFSRTKPVKQTQNTKEKFNIPCQGIFQFLTFFLYLFSLLWILTKSHYFGF